MLPSFLKLASLDGISVECWQAGIQTFAPQRCREHQGIARIPFALCLLAAELGLISVNNARQGDYLLLKSPETLEPDKKAALERMLNTSPVVRSAYNFAQAFLRMVRNRYTKALRPWLRAVIECNISELAGFAKSLKQDFNAVYAALSLPWSNGQVEGQVNRPRLIKRQMYGQASSDLLRVRVMAS
jgi:transposase